MILSQSNLEQEKEALLNLLAEYNLKAEGAYARDINVILDALAYFSAHNKEVTHRFLALKQQVFFHQLFPYLLTPMPYEALLQFNVDAHLSDANTLPAEQSIVVSHVNADHFHMRLLKEQTLLPLNIQKFEIHGHLEGNQLNLHLSSHIDQYTPLPMIPIHISSFNEYGTSLALYANLKKALTGVTLKVKSGIGGAWRDYQANVLEDSSDTETYLDHAAHSLQQIRSFLHMPEKELFLMVVPQGEITEWKEIVVSFHVDKSWIADPVPTQHSFHLYVSPVSSLNRGFAVEYELDGSQDRYILKHTDQSMKYQFHSCLGVYTKEDNELSPIMPGFLASEEMTYDIEQNLTEISEPAFVRVYAPKTAMESRALIVDALWTQAYPKNVTERNRQVSLYDTAIPGVSCDFFGPISQMTANPYADNLDAMNEILSLKDKVIRTKRELSQLFYLLGVNQSRHYKPVFKQLDEVVFTESISNTGPVYHYDIKFKNVSKYLAERLCQLIWQSLSLWMPVGTVEINHEVVTV